MVVSQTTKNIDYETVIGLEVHVQLSTKSKMYCSCSAAYSSAPPNTHVCPVCLGLPGSLPVINKQAVEYTMMMGLALNCNIAEHSHFDRKSYPYPDLMKGFQISQYDAPLAYGGWIDIETEQVVNRIRITRVHLEEDVSKLLHQTNSLGEIYSLVDVNRSGVPLMEVVSEPDIRSPEEARHYLMTLHSIVRYLGISTGNMEEGSFRCDANISIRERGTTRSNNKVEVKNMNSFKAVYQALSFEAQRQRELVQKGEHISMETRGWVDNKEITVSQRSKEYAHDYRYFPEPDLPPLVIERNWVTEIQKNMPELAQQKRDRFVEQYGLSLYDASLLTESRALADYFETCLKSPALQNLPKQKAAKELSNWLLGEFNRLLNLSNIDITRTKITPQMMGELIVFANDNIINISSGKVVLEVMFQTGKIAKDIIAEMNLARIGDTSAIDEIVKQAIQANPDAVADYKRGKEQALKFLVGQVMRISKGRADAKITAEIIKQNLIEGE